MTNHHDFFLFLKLALKMYTSTKHVFGNNTVFCSQCMNNLFGLKWKKLIICSWSTVFVRTNVIRPDSYRRHCTVIGALCKSISEKFLKRMTLMKFDIKTIKITPLFVTAHYRALYRQFWRESMLFGLTCPPISLP